MKITKITSLILLVVLISFGCAESEQQNTKVNKPTLQKEQVKPLKPQQTQSGELDKFGRKPGDPHYGHNHASNEPHSNTKVDSIAKPATGEVDKFGRKPGDPHYGHNHQ